MRLWSREEARSFFESGGETRPPPRIKAAAASDGGAAADGGAEDAAGGKSSKPAPMSERERAARDAGQWKKGMMVRPRGASHRSAALRAPHRRCARPGVTALTASDAGAGRRCCYRASRRPSGASSTAAPAWSRASMPSAAGTTCAWRIASCACGRRSWTSTRCRSSATPTTPTA
eukprot:2326164-Prymnesium_polylepis.1